jgi:hypothetical protein
MATTATLTQLAVASILSKKASDELQRRIKKLTES